MGLPTRVLVLPQELILSSIKQNHLHHKAKEDQLSSLLHTTSAYLKNAILLFGNLKMMLVEQIPHMISILTALQMFINLTTTCHPPQRKWCPSIWEISPCNGYWCHLSIQESSMVSPLCFELQIVKKSRQWYIFPSRKILRVLLHLFCSKCTIGAILLQNEQLCTNGQCQKWAKMMTMGSFMMWNQQEWMCRLFPQRFTKRRRGTSWYKNIWQIGSLRRCASIRRYSKRIHGF